MLTANEPLTAGILPSQQRLNSWEEELTKPLDRMPPQQDLEADLEHGTVDEGPTMKQPKFKDDLKASYFLNWPKKFSPAGVCGDDSDHTCRNRNHFGQDQTCWSDWGEFLLWIVTIQNYFVFSKNFSSNFFYGLLPSKIILSSAQMKIYFSSNFFYGLLPPKIILSSAQMKIYFSSDFFNSYEKNTLHLQIFSNITQE